MRLLPALALFALIGCRKSDADEDGFDAGPDCNDADAAVSPDAAETCDGVDNNCDGLLDEGATDALTFYFDRDGDGHGDLATTTTACEAPSGHVTTSDDCDDELGAAFPGADEADCADPIDYNCDGSTGYADADADGFAACQDCDDKAAAINPDGVEACDGVDNDCDGATDEAGSTGATAWFADKDDDGYGQGGDVLFACAAPEGYVGNALDCNDSAATAMPGGVEACDGIDNDCDGVLDDNAGDAKTYYADVDGDGAGATGRTVTACAAPPGYGTTSGDCNDARSDTFPGAAEVCDKADNNCDGTADEGFDLDTDGVTTCSGDCNDARADVLPGGKEVCDLTDNDCDGAIDEDVANAPTWYVDYDDDGHGSALITVVACAAPNGFSADDADCDDLDVKYSPSATPGCDGEDYDCDGVVDNDADGDDAPDQTCGGWDCDDADPAVFAGNTETTYNGTDDDCDATTLDDDLDQDTYALAQDCNDLSKAINPGATELWYDGVDQNCDAKDDYDQDGDGHKAASKGGDDCNDTDATRFTGCQDGLLQANAGVSCNQIHTSYPSAPDGAYWLDPENDGNTSNAFQAACDMNDNGGGWTLISRYSSLDTANWMINTGDWWYDRVVGTGATTAVTTNADMINPAFWRMAGAEIKITRTDVVADTALLVTTANCLGNTPFRTKLTSYGTYRDLTPWATNAVRGSCAVTYGGSYTTTQGFQMASCVSPPNIGSNGTVSFYGAWSSGDGAVLMIGGGGDNCNRADHGIGVTEANSAAFNDSGAGESDFGNDAGITTAAYALNLWVK